MSTKKTDWKEYKDGKTPLRIQATYGMDYEFAKKHNQAPYFSLTGTIDEKVGKRWIDYSGGQLHGEIAEHFPDLVPLAKWHLVSTEGPMHYLANGKYWWDMQQGKVYRRPYDPDPVEAFKSTIVLGAVEDDELPPLKAEWPDVERWLKARLPVLLVNFENAMRGIGVWEET